MIGSSAAWLAKQRHPEWRIVLLDRSLAGYGASLYAASLEIPFGHTPLRRDLVRRSQRIFGEFQQVLPGLPRCEIAVEGLVEAADVEKLLSGFLDGNESHRARPEDEADLLRRYSGLIIPPRQVYLKGWVGSRAFRNEIAPQIAYAFSQKVGASLRQGTAVLDVVLEAERFVLSLSQGEKVQAQRVLIATGPWAMPGRIGEAARDAGIRIKKVAAFHLNKCPKPNASNLHFFSDDAFLLPQPEVGRWLMSFRSNEWDVNPRSEKMIISQADLAVATAILEKYMPTWIPHIQGGQVFCDAYTSTGDPIGKRVTGWPGCVIAGAASGSGFRLGPGIAEMALELLETNN